MSSRIQVRRGTAQAWGIANPVLLAGEPGFETDTGREKRGDGVTAWSSLGYMASLGINVLDRPYGAKGDGVTDDTAAIQAAITAGAARYASTGGTASVVLPPGYEFLLGQVSIKSGVSLSAYGAAIIPNLSNWPQVTAGLLFWSGVGILSDFAVYGGTWLGTGSETSNQTVFFTGSNRGVQDLRLRDMKISGWNLQPFYIRNPTRARVTDNTIISPVGVTSTFNDINFVFDGSAAATGEIEATGNIIENSFAASIAAVVTATYAGAVKAIFANNITSGVAASTASSNNSGAIVLEIDAALADTNALIIGNDINATCTNAGAYAVLVGNTSQNDTPGKALVALNNIKSVQSAFSIGHVSSEVTVALNRIDAASFLTGASSKPTVQFGNRFASTGSSQGQATLVAGTVTVSTAEIQAGDNVSLTVVVPGGTRGMVQLGTIVAGTSFVINSIQPGTASTVQASDTSTVFWKIEH